METGSPGLRQGHNLLILKMARLTNHIKTAHAIYNRSRSAFSFVSSPSLSVPKRPDVMHIEPYHLSRSEAGPKAIAEERLPHPNRPAYRRCIAMLVPKFQLNHSRLST
jgi:hypothetical protein